MTTTNAVPAREQADRELLELAAQAAGLIGTYRREHQTYGDCWVDGLDCGGPIFWNPLSDDGAALRLAVKLGLDLLRTERDIEAIAGLPPYAPMERDRPAPFAIELLGDDPCAATRRAIVRAAANIVRAAVTTPTEGA